MFIGGEIEPGSDSHTHKNHSGQSSAKLKNKQMNKTSVRSEKNEISQRKPDLDLWLSLHHLLDVSPGPGCVLLKLLCLPEESFLAVTPKTQTQHQFRGLNVLRPFWNPQSFLNKDSTLFICTEPQNSCNRSSSSTSSCTQWRHLDKHL